MKTEAIEYIGEAIVALVGFVIGWFSKHRKEQK